MSFARASNSRAQAGTLRAVRIHQVSDEKRRLSDATASIATETARKANAIREKAYEESIGTALEATREAQQIAYNGIKETFDAQARLTIEAQRVVDDIQAELKELRQKIVDSEAIEEDLTRLVWRYGHMLPTHNSAMVEAQHWNIGYVLAVCLYYLRLFG